MNRNVIISIIFVFLFMIIIFLNNTLENNIHFYKQRVIKCESIIKQTETKLQFFISQNELLAQYKAELHQYNLIESRQTKWSIILNQIMKGLPKTVWLESLIVHPQKSSATIRKASNTQNHSNSKMCYDILLQGKATNRRSVNTLLHALNDIKGLSSSQIESMNSHSLLWQFQIVSRLN